MTLLDMENKESILSALTNLELDGKPPAVLEEYLREIAKHGLTFIPWVHIKPLVLLKFNHVLDEFIDDIDENMRQSLLRPSDLNDLRERVYRILSQFEGIPFTIQRICELLTDPRKYYTRPDKFLRGFEKVCLVVSTVDAYGNKIHYVEPRLSGNIERSTSVFLNGSSCDSRPVGSGEESPIGSKRSDGEDEDADDITARRPCINFYRRSPSKLVEGLKNSFGDSLIGAYSPGIPGKHTLQRPFLSGRSSISFNTIFEDAENSSATVDDDDVGEFKREIQERETSVEETDIEDSESQTSQALESLSQSTHTLTGIQKLFMEAEEEETNKLTTAVPPIDQMLRPMGQLEAFVNTISMVTATSVSGAISVTPNIISETVPEESDLEKTETGPEDDGSNSKQEEEFENPITENQPPKQVASDESKEEEACPSLTEQVVTSPSYSTRSSLKRDSTENALVTLASPAKRMRLGTELPDKAESNTELIDIHFSSTMPIATNCAESTEDSKQSVKQPFKEESNRMHVSSENSQSSTPKDEVVEAPTPQLQGQILEAKHHTTVKSDTGERELLK